TFNFDHDRLGFSLWGRMFSLELNVRSGLVEFIHKLQSRGIKIGLSSWIRAVREGRHSLHRGRERLCADLGRDA
ncbi:MAG: hypothetical protein IKS28_04745, partial [Clostridia bacterium]|nr:hypothetical protein [Clostridia bacterium]